MHCIVGAVYTQRGVVYTQRGVVYTQGGAVYTQGVQSIRRGGAGCYST